MTPVTRYQGGRNLVLFKVIYRFYFINFMLYIFLCQSENLYELRHQILFVMSNIFKGIKFNRGVYKKNCNTKYLSRHGVIIHEEL